MERGGKSMASFFRRHRAITLLAAFALAQAGSAEAATSASDHIAEARQLLASGKSEEAIVAFEAALRLDPRNGAAHNGLGSLLNAAGRYAEALPHAEAAVAADPDNGRYLYTRGLVRAEHGRFDEAVADFDRAIAAFPDMTYAYLERSAAKLSLDDWTGAEADWELARKSDPSLIWTHWYPAMGDFIAGNYSGAAEALDRVAADQPDFLAASLWRYLAHGRTGNRLPIARSANRDWPASAIDYLQGRISARRLMAIAKEDRMSGDPRRVGEAYFFMAQHALMRFRFKEAEKLFRRAIAVDAPRHVWKISAERELQQLETIRAL